MFNYKQIYKELILPKGKSTIMSNIQLSEFNISRSMTKKWMVCLS